MALLNAQEAIDSSALEADEATGSEIIRKSLEEPIRHVGHAAAAHRGGLGLGHQVGSP